MLETKPTVSIVDDDEAVRDSLSLLLESHGYRIRSFASGRLFLESAMTESSCVLLDVRMPDMSGLELQERLVEQGVTLPVIIITGHADVPMAVSALKVGACDFIEKPYSDDAILESVKEAVRAGEEARRAAESNRDLEEALARLTRRERQVLDRLVTGEQNKVIAYELGISPRTVEVHRARVMEKMGVKSLPRLVRMMLEHGREATDS